LRDCSVIHIDAVLDGIECFHTKHSTSISEHYLQIADELHLLVTGGSDCHGMNKGKPLIGTIKLPYQHVERLKERVRRNSKGQPPKVTEISNSKPH
jgi:hypothetical protein